MSVKLIRANLQTKEASLELLRIRNLESTRLWTNDPDNVIELDTHLAYLKTRLGSSSVEDKLIAYLVLDDDGAVTGYQRFDLDRENPDVWSVSTAFLPSSQGKGYGIRSMKQSINQLATDLAADARPIASVHAWIHPENIPSIKMCLRSGFVRTDRQITDKVSRVMDLYVCSVPQKISDRAT